MIERTDRRDDTDVIVSLVTNMALVRTTVLSSHLRQLDHFFGLGEYAW